MFSSVGAWKSVKELEDNLSMQDVFRIIESMYEQQHEKNKFLAAIQGVDIGDSGPSDQERYDAVKRRAEAALAGQTEEEFTFATIGIEVETE